MVTDLVKEAAELAASGYRVMPLRQKTPLVANWPEQASSDPAQLEKWWQQWPGANIGIATGRGLVVIDADAGGEETLTQLETELGALPDTRRVRTAHGGLHLYFKTDAEVGNSVRTLGAGLDVRGEGGQVVAPPSIVDGRPYTYEDDGPVAELPARWLERLLSGPATRRQQLQPGELVASGGRNDYLFGRAAAMRGLGLDAGSIERALQAENEFRCRPPLSTTEVAQIAASASRYQVNPPAPVILHGRQGASEDEPEPAQAGPAPTFPLEALPAAASALVRAGATSFGLDRAFFALPALTVLGAAIGNSHKLAITDSWATYPALWTCVVAPPGAGKTPASKLMLTPLEAWQRYRDDEYLDALSRYEAAGDDKADRPVARRIVAGDITLEALAIDLAGNPRGLLIDRDEILGVFTALNQYKGGKGSDRETLLSLWSAKTLRVRRVTRSEVMVAEPVVSIVGGCQPSRVAEIGDGSDGMLDRILFARPPCDQPAQTRDVGPAALHNWNELVLRLLDIPALGRVVHLGVEARAAWRTHDSLRQQRWRDAISDEERATIGKMQAHAARLTLIHHVCRVTEGELAESAPVSALSVQAGWLLAAYFLDHAALVYGPTVKQPERLIDRQVDAVIAAVRRRGGSCAVRTLAQAGIAGARSNSDLDSVLRRLVQTKRGIILEEAAGGNKMRRVVQVK